MPDEILEIDGEFYIIGWHVEQHRHLEKFSLEDVAKAIEFAPPQISNSHPEHLVYIHDGLLVAVHEDSKLGLHTIVTAYRIKF